MPSALMLPLSLAALMTQVMAEADADPLTLILAPGGWSLPTGHYYPGSDSAPSQHQTFLNPQGHPAVVQQQRNLANFPRFTEPARIQPHSQFFLKLGETLPVTQSLVPGLLNENYNKEGSVLTQNGWIQPSRGVASNVGANQQLPTVFSPIPLRGNINSNTVINRGISHTIRNDQNLIGNNRKNTNDRFINSNSNRNPIIRDHNSNSRQSKYNCSSDGIFPDQNSDCQRYYICQRNQVISYRQQKQRQNCKIISKVWEFDCGLGQLYDASQGACAPAYTVDNWCNVPNTVNYGPGTSSYNPGSKIVVDMSGILC